MIKTPSNFHLRAILSLAVLLGFATRGICSIYPQSIQSALDEVSSRCPKTYPDIITPLPEPGDLEGKSQQELLTMEKTWNPSLRAAVSKELASRGDAVMPLIKKMLGSEESAERQVAAAVTHAILQYKIKNWSESFPEETNWRIAQTKVREKYSDLIPMLIPLCKDSDRATREKAISALGELQARRKDVSEAILPLFGDPDEYLAQQAMSILGRYIGVEGVDQDALFDAFAAGMKQPLPGGKGNIIKLIGEQDAAFQKRCIPLLIGHLKWVPNRDTMGATSGQAESISLLTSLKEESLIEYIPFLMKKEHRGNPAYFEPAVESAAAFGPKAKKLLPLLTESLKECSKELEEIEAKGVDRRTQSRFDLLKKREQVLKKGIEHVSE